MVATPADTAVPPPRARPYDVAASDEVAEGGRLVVEVGPVTVGVFRFRGRLYAYENVCAHQGGPACQGRIVARVREDLDEVGRSRGTVFDTDAQHIVCPWHGFEYDVTTGRHPGRPDVALRLLAVATRCYEVASEEGATPLAGDDVTPTGAVVLATAALRAHDLNPFDLALCFSRDAKRSGTGPSRSSS